MTFPCTAGGPCHKAFTILTPKAGEAEIICPLCGETYVLAEGDWLTVGQRLYQDLAVTALRIFFDKCDLLAEKVIAAHPQFAERWHGQIAEYKQIALVGVKVQNPKGLANHLEMIRCLNQLTDPSQHPEPPEDYWWTWLPSAVADAKDYMTGPTA